MGIDYDAINDEWVLDSPRQQFIDWLLLTPKARTQAGLPQSQKAMAEHLGFSEQTLMKWKKDRRFNDELLKRQRELNLTPDKVQLLLERLYDDALDGDQKSAALWLQVVGKHQPETKVVVERQDIREMSDAELERMLEEQLAELRRKQQ